MDTRHMRLFVALAETRHFGQAAARMNMTQPPFSRQIANLERDIGTQLVERSSRQVRLTAAGRRFYSDALEVLARFDAACRDARRVAEGVAGDLRLGFMMHAAHRLVPELLRDYTALRPDVRVHLDETTPGEIDDLVLTGVLDAGITFAGPMTPLLQEVAIMTDQLCLVCARDHVLAGRTQIGPADLIGHRLLAAPAQVAPMLRAAIVAFLGRAGQPAEFHFEPKLQNTLLRLVAADLGVALVPASICDPLGEGLVARPLIDPPQLSIVLKTRCQSDNPAVAPLLDLVRGRRRAVGDNPSGTTKKAEA